MKRVASMLYTIQNKYLKICVVQFGAVLTSIQSKISGHEFLWQGDPSVWNGQSPILFPIIGKLLDDKCRIDGKEYEIIRHGLARHRNFTCISERENELVFLQKNDDETKKAYPYNYELYITFTIDKNSLTVTHTVKNPNAKTMYFSLGAHPAFNCARGDKLVFEKRETLVSERIDHDSVITGETDLILENSDTLLLTEHLFDKDALIFEGVQSDFVTLHCEQAKTEMRFTFGGVPFLAIWAKPAAPFVCIEPWYGVNDSYEKKADFSEKRGIVSLPAGETFAFSWTAEFFENEANGR